MRREHDIVARVVRRLTVVKDYRLTEGTGLRIGNERNVCRCRPGD